MYLLLLRANLSWLTKVINPKTYSIFFLFLQNHWQHYLPPSSLDAPIFSSRCRIFHLFQRFAIRFYARTFFAVTFLACAGPVSKLVMLQPTFNSSTSLMHPTLLAENGITAYTFNCLHQETSLLFEPF